MHEAWPPRWLSPVAEDELERGDGLELAEFGEQYCRITRDSIGGLSGEHIVFRKWQTLLCSHLLARRADGRYKHRQALIGMARKNGKSQLSAVIALFSLVFGVKGGEVYSIAGDREQARIVFGTARDMVKADPELSAMFDVYRDSIIYPETGSVYKVRSAESYTAEGLNPSLVIADEVHVQPRDLWDVFALASGSRREPLMVGITTAGVKTDSSGRDSLCYEMYQYGQKVARGEIDDPTFFFSWWEPKDPNADHRLPQTWREANPGYDDIVSEEDFKSAVLRTSEAEFRTKRCNQWVSSAITWMPAGAWDECADEGRVIKPGEEVVLALDGSFNGDCTALMACSIPKDGALPHLQVVRLWETPPGKDTDWTVPVLDVEEEVRQACRRWQVLEVTADPYGFQRTLQVLEEEGLPMVEFPQNTTRMTPATNRMYEAVMNQQVSHSGDVRLARHIENCVLRDTPRGQMLAKEKRGSKKFIDLAVAAVMALDRAWSCEAGSIKSVQNVW